MTSVDMLNFTGAASYTSKLEKYRKSTGAEGCRHHRNREGRGTNEWPWVVMDFSFLGGSMGSVVGEKLTRLIEKATEKGLPLIIVST